MSITDLKERGIRAAAAFVENRGMKVLETEWSCSYGTVDIIADDNGTTVFITVKSRKATAKGIPEDVVSKNRERTLKKIAGVFFKKNELLAKNPVRYDAIAIYAFSESQALLRYVRDLFVTELGGTDGEE